MDVWALGSSKSSAVPGGQKPLGPPIQATELDVHESHSPIATWRFDEPDHFAAHRFTDKHLLPLPLNLSGLTDTSHLMCRVIPGLLEPRGIGPG